MLPIDVSIRTTGFSGRTFPAAIAAKARNIRQMVSSFTVIVVLRGGKGTIPIVSSGATHGRLRGAGRASNFGRPLLSGYAMTCIVFAVVASLVLTPVAPGQGNFDPP